MNQGCDYCQPYYYALQPVQHVIITGQRESVYPWLPKAHSSYLLLLMLGRVRQAEVQCREMCDTPPMPCRGGEVYIDHFGSSLL
jgi:hypothetical protein